MAKKRVYNHVLRCRRRFAGRCRCAYRRIQQLSTAWALAFNVQLQHASRPPPSSYLQSTSKRLKSEFCLFTPPSENTLARWRRDVFRWLLLALFAVAAAAEIGYEIETAN